MDADGLSATPDGGCEAADGVADSEELLRAVRRLPEDVSTGTRRPHWKAFITKPPESDGAISVDRLALSTVEQSVARWHAKKLRPKGVVSVGTLAIRLLDLDVEPRPSRGNLAHAAITGLPYFQDHSQRARAKRIALLLRDQAVVVAECDNT